jgi:ATP-dependent Clp protease adapter protein ClpS
METSKSSGNIKKRRPRRKRMHLYLLNDDINTVDYVIEILSSVIPMCNSLRAEQIAMIVHNVGECNVYSGFPPAIYLLYVKLTKAGLNAQIREYKPKRK